MGIKELSTRYEPKETEKKWYEYWVSRKYFRADENSSKPRFSMVIPPPNVTGALHVGHALNNTLQDALCRYKRMQGFEVLWLPGTDHASIATQNVVEKDLMATEKKTRHDIGREAFVKRAREWKEKYGGRIVSQLKLLGCSCDWDRERFTMDEGMMKAVNHVFVELYKDGLIYRGNYIISWCPRCRTALSDIEVEHKEKNGHLWHIKYPVVDSKEFVTVATTRPETMLGDTAVAVNPKDHRWSKFVGRKLELPLTGRQILVVADEKVEMEFGTGAVKVTPAHDLNDFEMGVRHNLEQICVMNLDATMNERAGKFKGLDRFKCRKAVVEELEALKLLEKIEDHKNSVSHCSRCDTVTEPIISLQWFMKMKPLADPAIKAVKEGEIKFIPASWDTTYFNWMENIRDWCISRQLWWGQRLPVYYCKSCGETIVSEEAPVKCSACGSEKIEQDPDVLDTWFSSQLWPFATMGWPEETKLFKKFYPTDMLSTGFDIIFFWVARMIMMGIKFTGEVPFKEAYLHALIRDAKGQKMSKSSGNVIDPVVIMDKYGTDAVRFTLGIFATQGRDIALAEERIEGYRNFANKLWNAARFCLMNLEGFDPAKIDRKKLDLTLADKWILSRLNAMLADSAKAFDTSNFDKAAQAMYTFTWHEFCDWYLELSKPRLNDKTAGKNGMHSERETVQFVMYEGLEKTLRALHPFMPFITEEIWQTIPHEGESIMKADWPKSDAAAMNTAIDEEMELIKSVIVSIRNSRSEANILPAAKIKALIKTADAPLTASLTRNKTYITDLAKIEELLIGADIVKPELCSTSVLPNVEIFVELEGHIDKTKEKERMRKELEGVEKELQSIAGKLSNENFVKRAPAAIVESEKAKQMLLTDKKAKLLENMKRMA